MTEEKQLGVWMPAETFNEIMNVLTRLPWGSVNSTIDKIQKTSKSDTPLGA